MTNTKLLQRKSNPSNEVCSAELSSPAMAAPHTTNETRTHPEGPVYGQREEGLRLSLLQR